MSGVFRNIDPPPPHRLGSVYPPAFGAGVGGSIVRKTPDTALYSIYVSTVCLGHNRYAGSTVQVPEPGEDVEGRVEVEHAG